MYLDNRTSRGKQCRTCRLWAETGFPRCAHTTSNTHRPRPQNTTETIALLTDRERWSCVRASASLCCRSLPVLDRRTQCCVWQCGSRAILMTSSFFFSSRRRHTRSLCDWSSNVCSSDLADRELGGDL